MDQRIFDAAIRRLCYVMVGANYGTVTL